MNNLITSVTKFASTLLAVTLGSGAARSFAAEPAESTKARTSITHADASEAAKLVHDKKVVVIDVRTPKEFAGGHVAGATNVNFNSPDFAKRLGELDKSKTYLVHCAAGGRSTKSLEVFKTLQFQSVVHLDGGFTAWQKAGNPVEK